MSTKYVWIHPVGENAGEKCLSPVIFPTGNFGEGRCDDHDRVVRRVEAPR